MKNINEFVGAMKEKAEEYKSIFTIPSTDPKQHEEDLERLIEKVTNTVKNEYDSGRVNKNEESNYLHLKELVKTRTEKLSNTLISNYRSVYKQNSKYRNFEQRLSLASTKEHRKSLFYRFLNALAIGFVILLISYIAKIFDINVALIKVG